MLDIRSLEDEEPEAAEEEEEGGFDEGILVGVYWGGRWVLTDEALEEGGRDGRREVHPAVFSLFHVSRELCQCVEGGLAPDTLEHVLRGVLALAEPVTLPGGGPAGAPAQVASEKV